MSPPNSVPAALPPRPDSPPKPASRPVVGGDAGSAPPAKPKPPVGAAPPPSRAGEKLFAALRTFRLEAAVRGATVLEVGASQGGVTDCLLRSGAARVTTIDAGHGQLRDPLRSDPRVVLLERTQFKCLAPAVAPGPFGFFVIAVTVVSVRAMLRILAARIEPGTPGVIVIKPQFEQPKLILSAAGDAESKHQRKAAFHRFKKTVAECGFSVQSRMDAPVAAPDGPLEIFAHVLCLSRPSEASTPEPIATPTAPAAPPTAAIAKPTAVIAKPTAVIAKPTAEAPAPQPKRPPKTKRPKRVQGTRGPSKV